MLDYKPYKPYEPTEDDIQRQKLYNEQKSIAKKYHKEQENLYFLKQQEQLRKNLNESLKEYNICITHINYIEPLFLCVYKANIINNEHSISCNVMLESNMPVSVIMDTIINKAASNLLEYKEREKKEKEAFEAIENIKNCLQQYNKTIQDKEKEAIENAKAYLLSLQEQTDKTETPDIKLTGIPTPSPGWTWWSGCTCYTYW